MKGLKLTERDVTRTGIDYLKAHGCECIRLHTGLFQRPGSETRIRIGRKGQADWIIVLPGRHVPFFLEFKAPGKKPNSDQALWRLDMVSRGFQVLVADSFEDVKEWMEQ